jgi:hypothetical protein
MPVRIVSRRHLLGGSGGVSMGSLKMAELVGQDGKYMIYDICIYTYTSSTAQGGGGSFKNRKPIGEVGCCKSGMAERSH